MEKNSNNLKNPEGYVDMTPHEALSSIDRAAMDEPDARHYRLIKTLRNLIGLADYELLNRIEVRDTRSGRIYR